MNAPRILKVGEEPPPMRTPEAEQRRAAAKTGKAKGQSGERFKTLNTFVDFALAELSRAEIAVWLILYRDTRDGSARTAYDDLARRAGCNRRNVGRAIRRLERLDLLKVIHRGGLGRGPSRYRVRPLPKDG
jgi:hypothetical protein